MNFLRTLPHLLTFSLMILWTACQTSKSLQASKMLAYFHPKPVSDTLHIEIDLDHDFKADTIPNRIFFSSIPKPFLDQIDYLADSSEALVLARMQFPLNEQVTAYWVEIRQFWFQHHSLFLYNRSTRHFINRITVAEWFGGDGGQVLAGSWIFDFNGDGRKDILRQEIQHSMVLQDEEPVEHQETALSLWLWQKDQFKSGSITDTARLIQKFPIRSFW
jgi:hypothetical protein